VATIVTSALTLAGLSSSVSGPWSVISAISWRLGWS